VVAIEQVNYDVLDRVKNTFIEGSKRTLSFAQAYGFVPNEELGASANVFSLDLKPFLKVGIDHLYVSLVMEGLGTADDARPGDLTPKESRTFWHNIAIKTVAAMTNDIACGGLQPILISLYLPSGDPSLVFDENFLQGFIEGFVSACKQVGCVWISGETPQLKEKIADSKVDCAGAVFGLTPPGKAPIDSSKLAARDKIVLVESSGPHENGFTALRKIANELPQGYRTDIGNGTQFWQAINAPSILYTQLIQKVITAGVQITNIENITGHGWQKLMRLRRPFCYRIKNVLPLTPVFGFLEQHAGWTKEQMLKVFNCGAGCAIFIQDVESAKKVVDIAASLGLKAVIAGEVETSAKRSVVVEPFGVVLDDEAFQLSKG
jgi:phosphoribosylformylglycinamidine cyclo-ligase